MTWAASCGRRISPVRAASSVDAQGSLGRIVGRGPFRIMALEPPQRFEVGAFEGHGGPQPAVWRTNCLAASRAESRALMAEAD